MRVKTNIVFERSAVTLYVSTVNSNRWFYTSKIYSTRAPQNSHETW